MNFETQHELLERLADIENLYAGMYPSRGKKYTIKWTRNTINGNGEARPYLYTWVNFADGETRKYSVEAGKWVERAGAAKQQRVYVCPVGKNNGADLDYYKGADTRVLDKIDNLRYALEKQIKMVGKRFNQLKDQQPTMPTSVLEQEAYNDLIERYPELFARGKKDLAEIEKMIEEEKTAKQLVMLFAENSEREKEEKRVKREQEKQLKRKAKKGV